MKQQSNDLLVLNHESETVIQPENTVSLSQIFHVFWLHRWVFSIVSLFIVTLGVLMLLQLVPRFTAEAKLLIGIPPSKVVNIQSVTDDKNTASAINDEIEVLTSRELAKKVIAKLNLLDSEEFNPSSKKTSFFSFLNPREWLPDEILGSPPEKQETSKEEAQAQLLASVTNAYLSGLKVSAIRGSQVIQITYESTNPKLAAKITNAHADSYITNQLDAKFEATQKATSWLNEQLAELRSKVQDSEKAVETYRATHNLTRGTSDTGLQREQLSEVNSQLIIARAERAQVAARLAQIQHLLKSGSNVDTAAEVVSSPIVQGLREHEFELARKASEMSVEYGEKHPQMIRIQAEIQEIHNKITLEIRKVAAGIENELSIATSREQSLQSSLRSVTASTSSSSKDEVQLRALEREAAANKLLFENFLTRSKETSSTQGTEEANARIISKAEIPGSASYPKKQMMFAVIVVAALFIASAIVFLLEMLNPGLRSPEEVERFLKLPTLGLIPSLVDKNRDPIDYILDKPQSQLAEAINSLRISLALSDVDNPVKTVMITSSVPEEGKSTLALALARSAANSGQKVLIIDADLRRPSLEKKLGLKDKTKAHQGLSDLLLSKENKVLDFVFKDEKTSLMIMPKGQTRVVSSVDILTSDRMKSLLEAFRKEFDFVIIDTPPVMAVADARALAPLVDKTVFIIQWDKTPKKVIKAGLQQMITAQPNVAGIVLQQVNLKRYGSYGYGGESGYYYHYGKYGQYYSN
jgi:capsular exopolysaccharide synthesis family protein